MASCPKNEHEEVYLYARSGIYERHGTIPVWLMLVVVALLIWGTCYMVQYWSAW